MKNYLPILFFCFLLLCSCNRSNPDNEDKFELKLDEVITVNGSPREYHIQHPANSENRPLVILLHGHGGSADQSIGQGTGMSPQKVWLEIAEEKRLIVAFPNGEIGPDDKQGWNDCRTDAPGNPSADDVLFLSSLIDEIQQEYSNDANRVYVAGVSNGASMAYRLAEEIPSKITAFASIITSIPINTQCTQSDEVISALYMNGTMDSITPYAGGEIKGDRGLVESTDESIQYWVDRNQTDTEPTVEVFNDTDTNDGSTVEKFTYDNGTDNSQVVLYRVNGGGHTEPSLVEKYSEVYLLFAGNQNHDIEMAEEVWKFFEDKTK